jgi:hypothetical protein
MNKLLHAATMTLFATSMAHGQQAVQWRVEDGGNGHWYDGKNPSPLVTWFEADNEARRIGGHLVTFTSAAEHSFVYSQLAGDIRYWHLAQGCGCLGVGPWIGLRRIGGTWSWVTGEPVTFTSWHPSEPWEPRDFVRFFHYVSPLTPAPLWDNADADASTGDESIPTSYIVEFDADCNGDGNVDYGQIREGKLPDFNGNNVPDCCETGVTCAIGNYPMQWRVEDGGNGHWYQLRPKTGGWYECRNSALADAGDLATPSTAQENAAIEPLIPMQQFPVWNRVFLGGYQTPGSAPSQGWHWVDGSPWGFTDWYFNQPNGSEGFLAAKRYGAGPTSCDWDDYGESDSDIGFFLVEWSADCNGDGVVDYGQILEGTLLDANGNNIPDACECRSDINGDRAVTGADLGLIFVYWGPAASFPGADLNADGAIDGADISVLLANWGPGAQ